MTPGSPPDQQEGAASTPASSGTKLDPATLGLVVVLAAFSSWAVALSAFLFEDPTAGSIAIRIAILGLCIATLALTLPCALSVGHLLRASPALWGMCALAGLSALWSNEPALTLRRSLLLALALLLAHALRRTRSQNGFLYILAAALTGLVGLSAVAALFMPELGDSRLGWRGILNHKNHLGFVAAMLATTLGVLACWAPKRPPWLAGLGLLACLLVLVPVHSVSAVLAVLMGLSVVIAGRLSDHRTSWRIPALALPLTLPVLIATNPRTFFDLVDRSPSLTNRVGIWRDLTTVVLERPVLGHGFGMDWHKVPELADSALVERGLWLIGAHNGVLQVGFWLGGVGMFALLLLVALVVVQAAVRFVKAEPGPERAFPLAMLAVIVTTAVTEDILLTAHIGWIVFCYLALALKPAASGVAVPSPQRHIAVFLPRLEGGGAERTLLVLMRWWVRQGIRVDLLVLQRQGAFSDEVPDGVRIVELGPARVRGAIVALARRIRSEQPDVVLACLNHTNVATVLAHGLAGTRTRVVLLQESSLPSTTTGASRGFSRLLRWCMAASYPWADVVVAPSGHIREELLSGLRLSPESIRHVPNPLATAAIQRQAVEPSGLAWLDNKQLPVVLAAGRLVPVKGFDVLVAALARLQQTREFRAIILGEGEEHATLQAHIDGAGLSHRVILAGFASNPFSAMARADVFVLPSRDEPFGNVLLEAMALGVPVVASRCPGGPSDILERGRWGHLVPPDDPEALAEAVLDVLDGRGIDARNRADHFGIDTIGPMYDSLLFGSSESSGVRRQ